MISRVGVALFATLVLCGFPPAYACDPGPVITGETRYKPHALVRLKAEGVDPRAGMIWQVFPESNIQQATTAEDLLEFAAPPGQYEISLLVVTQREGGGLKVTRAKTVVVIESCHPPEPAPPKPTPPKPDPTPPAPPEPAPPGAGKLDASGALGKIQFQSAGCTATVIGPRRSDGRWWVLTAAHCVPAVGSRGSMTMPAGQKASVRVVSHHPTQDLAWMVTEEAGLSDLCYARLADRNPEVAVPVWHQGYGVQVPRNREDGTVLQAENHQGQLTMRLSVSSGDSGGGIFRSDTNELVSVVCCTMNKGTKVTMWGGSVEQARRLRPADPADTPATPRPLPPRSEWTPLEIPTREVTR